MVQVFETKIKSIYKHSDEIKSFEIEIPTEVEWNFIPGQYIDLALIENPKEYSGFSLTSSPNQKDVFSISVKKADEGGLTEKLFQLNEGDPVIIRGPSGTFNLDFENISEAVLLGGGIGVTPLISMYKTGLMHPNAEKIALFHSAKSVQELIFYEKLDSLAKSKSHITYIPVVTRQDDWQGQSERISIEQVLEVVNDEGFKEPWFYICGPGDFNKQFQNALIERGYDKSRVHIESYYEP